jgi:4-hydroxy-tetrahydrodipicolinate reductase
MLEVLVSGCSGKMGQVVCDLVEKSEFFVLSCGFDGQNNGQFAFPVYSDPSSIAEQPDVIIDFSVPKATLTILPYAVSHHIPIVIATTGFSEQEINLIKQASQTIPIFQSANMSYDINLMKKLVTWLAPYLADTDIEITETHHNRKIDSPSGTANMLAETINHALNDTHFCEYHRHEKREKRNPLEIGMNSIRGGNIVGEHVVQFFGEFETFEIKHTTYSRDVFAEGALKAAKFITQQQPGYYTMDDIGKLT